jgi:hypothetical protein
LVLVVLVPVQPLLAQMVKIVPHSVRHLLVVVAVQHHIQEQMQALAARVVVELAILATEVGQMALELQAHHDRAMTAHPRYHRAAAAVVVLEPQAQE